MNLILAKNFILMLGMICMFDSIPFAFAQNQDSWINNEQEKIRKFNELDGLLTAQIMATLTGLSLAGASFLVRVNKNETTVNIEHARKNLIKSLMFYLTCLAAIFVFDSMEILFESKILIMISDIVVTYGLFGIGSFYLVRGARGIYDLFA